MQKEALFMIKWGETRIRRKIQHNTFEIFQNIFPENLTSMFKSPYIAKSEKPFWFLTTLTAFVIAYVFSMIRTGF